MSAGRFVALDVGDKTLGVAASDEYLRKEALWPHLDELAAILEEREATRIVVGLPLNMDDTEGPRAQKTRRFAERLRERFPLPVVLWDERLTTWEAERLLREAGARRQKKKERIDAIAAQLLLQSYLDAGAPQEGL
mgnify:CR=1 FL=1